MRDLILKLEKERSLSKAEWMRLIGERTPESSAFLLERAQAVRHAFYGRSIYIRGLIEFTNHCKNDCYYCGIRCSNRSLSRYRMTEAEILSCCQNGYELGFRTFVLQGGEDNWFTQERMTALIAKIRHAFPDCAITLSVGEREREEYQAYFDAGADRFLLRHETAEEAHYRQLHPKGMELQHRKECLWHLKEIGYQTGSGIMVGTPGQKTEHLAEDMLFLQELRPQMVGIGPFLPHKDTPFSGAQAGSLELTLYLLGLVRLLLPTALIPATTALSTLHPEGRRRGILAGANVLMPNLSPVENRKNYSLYDNKRCMDSEAAEGLFLLKEEMKEIGYEIVMDRGDAIAEGKAERYESE
ncbi:MAG: [FeFe] hydrogenase H-cluster radical SAM maturase HydE [Bacillota bacterium]|nr:[FeFe] hydrogenase H-cluster radical SAM maturase HydE [Bacillota bacterium]